MDPSFVNPASAVGATGITRRTAPRVPARMRARIRDRYGNRFDAHILDLSVDGFRADVHYAFDPGQLVWLTIPKMEGFEGVIAWRRETIVGARFRRPLHPAVLAHIVTTIRR